MTVLVWDGTTFAADKLACSGTSKGTVTKIFDVGGVLVGFAGALSIGRAMLDWYKKGAIPDDFPVYGDDDDAILIAIGPDKVVSLYENTPYPILLEDTHCAFGSGEEAALVAMACGCNAREAVEIVSRYNISCGNGVDSLTHGEQSDQI